MFREFVCFVGDQTGPSSANAWIIDGAHSCKIALSVTGRTAIPHELWQGLVMSLGHSNHNVYIR
jgi:hypothetical protein